MGSYPLDVLANVNTVFGQATVTAAFAGVLGLVAWRREPRLAWLAAGLFVLAASGVLLKLVLSYPPPGHEYDRALWNPLSVRFPTPSGFPSGHVARLTFLALFAFGLTRSRAIRAGLIAFIGYTFLARVYIGDHWLIDAIGGLALGVFSGCIALWWLARCRAYAPAR